MNFFKKIYCRSYQGIVRCILPFMPFKNAIVKNDYQGLGQELRKRKIFKVLIVTMKSASANGLLDDLLEELDSNSIQYFIYDKTKPNPTEDLVEEGKFLYFINELKGIIALGGGSAIDLAKAIGARIANPKKKLKDLKGLLHVKNEIPFFVAIPTTAGTGSETTVAAVITNEEENLKYAINDFKLIPDYALLDYHLTLDLPKNLTATTGLDALTHAVEAYLGHSLTKSSKRKAEFAVELIVKNLKIAYDKPHNMIARLNMLYASYYAGLAFTRSFVGYVHAIAHSLGGKYDVAHGLANAIILPVVLEEYGPKVYKKLSVLAHKSGLVKDDVSEEEAAKCFINWIKENNKYMNIPTSFDCIKEEDIDELASKADKEANPLYPVPVLFDKLELKQIYYKIKSNN